MYAFQCWHRSASSASSSRRKTLAAIASRNRLAPQVIAYWLTSASIAALAAALSSGGHGKSGNPCDRLIASCSSASRVISRITDSVNEPTFLLTLIPTAPWLVVPHTQARQRYPTRRAVGPCPVNSVLWPSRSPLSATWSAESGSGRVRLRLGVTAPEPTPGVPPVHVDQRHNREEGDQ